MKRTGECDDQARSQIHLSPYGHRLTSALQRTRPLLRFQTNAKGHGWGPCP